MPAGVREPCQERSSPSARRKRAQGQPRLAGGLVGAWTVLLEFGRAHTLLEDARLRLVLGEGSMTRTLGDATGMAGLSLEVTISH